MDKKNKKILFLFFSLAVLAVLFLSRAAYVKASTNISGTPNLYWAWNDVVGWIDHYHTNTIFLTGTKLQGYASSTAGDISYDCATSRSGSCAFSYGVTSTVSGSTGSLSGWAWNDVYGWISMCGGQHTSNCPGSIAYQVKVDMNTGIFTGYAWNDVMGYISYNCGGNVDGNSCGITYKVVAGAATSTVGTLDSTPYDTGVQGGAQINSVLWRGTLPSGTSVYFQFAESNNSSGPWNFIGPNNIGGLYDVYGPVSPDTSYSLSYVLNNNYRYFKYRIILHSDTWEYQTPSVNQVIVNWSP